MLPESSRDSIRRRPRADNRLIESLPLPIPRTPWIIGHKFEVRASYTASDGTHHHSAVGTLCERSGGAMNDAEKLPSYEELAEEVRQLREQFDATLQRLKQAERFRAESRQVLEEAEKILQTMDSLAERISDRVNDALRTSEN